MTDMTETQRSPSAATTAPPWMVWAGSLLLSVLAWIPTVQQAHGMSSILGTMGMPLGSFLVFWTLMMVAMMGPSVAPIVALHLETVRPVRPHGPPLLARGSAFVLSYLLVWSAVGLPIFGLAMLEGYVASTAPPVALTAGALVLVVAGFYQMTPLQARCLASCKQARCLASCNRHLGAPTHLPNAHSLLQDVSAGLAHSMDCVGVCGGCMLALVAVGLMNLPWMIAITLIVGVEKVWRYGDHVAVVVGVGLLLLGILMAVDPRLILGL